MKIPNHSIDSETGDQTYLSGKKSCWTDMVGPVLVSLV